MLPFLIKVKLIKDDILGHKQQKSRWHLPAVYQALSHLWPHHQDSLWEVGWANGMGIPIQISADALRKSLNPSGLQFLTYNMELPIPIQDMQI